MDWNSNINTRKQVVVITLIIGAIVLVAGCENEIETETVIHETEIIAEGLGFAEGPAYFNGELFFTDIQASRIYKWNKESGLQVYMENTGAANGLFFDEAGNLVVCEGSNKRLVSIDNYKNISVLTDSFEDKPYNEPNDVWISPDGNMYFTDPVFSGTHTQKGEYVYCYLSTGRQVINVEDALIKPNGIIGDPERGFLYIADYGASRIYRYSTNPTGELSEKQLFAQVRADGLSIDGDGNIYAAGEEVFIFNLEGELIGTIEVEGTLTNICISEQIGRIAYITTHNKIYKRTLILK